MKYKIGDKVIIKDLNWYENHKDESNYILENHGKDVFQDWIKKYGGKEAIIVNTAPDSPQYKLEIPNFEDGFTSYAWFDGDYFYKSPIERVGDFLLIYDYDYQLEKPTGERHLIPIDSISHIYETPSNKNLISIITKVIGFQVEVTLEEVIKLLKQK